MAAASLVPIGSDDIGYSYQRSSLTAGIQLRVEESGDLAGWAPLTERPIIIDLATGLKMDTLELSRPQERRSFFRIRVLESAE